MTGSVCRTTRFVSCLLPVLALAGCSFAPVVSNFSLSYDGSLEDVNNQLLVTNIIRAANRAPLYYSDLSIIRGQIGATLQSQLTAPFGEGRLTTTKHFTELANASVQSQPSFEVHPLNQQDFTQGILRPIELEYGKYYWDRLDYPEFILAMLFVDRIEVRFSDAAGNPAPVRDFTTGMPVPCAANPCATVEEFLNQPDNPRELARFVDIIRSWGVRPENPRTQRSVSYHSYLSLIPVGEEIQKDRLPPATSLDPRRYRTRRLQSDVYQLYAVENRIIICPPEQVLQTLNQRFHVTIAAPQFAGNVLDVSPNDAAACTAPEFAPEPPLAREAKPGLQITVYTRSVEGIIEYLGAILRRYEDAPDNPIRFYVHRGPVAGEKISLVYDGISYRVAPYRDDQNDTLGDDNTLPILALVEQLLNLRKSSKEIQTTPAAVIVQ